METTDITPIIDRIRERVALHKLAPGSYARYLWQDAKNTREMGSNPYGCADAANILYSIGDFPRDEEERRASVAVLSAMQGDDGLFREHTHHYIHTTAHCSAALELFDAQPAKPCTALLPYLDTAELYRLLEGLNWAGDPWSQSHQGAGIYVAMNLTGAADPDWNRAYFDWFWNNADPGTGFWCGKKGSTPKAPLYTYMAGGFHYFFNHEYAHMPVRYPERIIDSCLSMYHEKDGLPGYFCRQSNFLEIDWVFCLTRAQRQTPYRFYEVREALLDFTDRYLAFWQNCDWEHDESVNDLHMLFGGVCTLAELQQTLRGRLLTRKPLKLVLDRRPFI